MKALYPTPVVKASSLDYLHRLQSRLAHRTHGKSYLVRRIRCSVKLFVTRMLEKLENMVR